MKINIKRTMTILAGICIMGYLIIAYTWMIGDIKQTIKQKQQRDQGMFEMLQR